MIGRAVTVLERVTLTPLLVRSGLFLSAVAALLLAAPAPLRTSVPVLVGLAALAAAPAIAPGGPWPTLVTLTTAAAWVLATEVSGQPVVPLRVLGLATLLYLLHNLAALAAALPSDAVVAPEVVLRWLARTAAVVAAAALLSAVTLTGLAEVAELAGLAGSRWVVATLAGLALAAALPFVLTRFVLRFLTRRS